MRTRTAAAAAAVVMVAATMGAAPVQAVDGVTVRHLPAKIRYDDANVGCIDFSPTLSGAAYIDDSLNGTTVTARGLHYNDFACEFGSKTRKRLLSRKGLTFTVSYSYEYRQSFTGSRTPWQSFKVYSDGDRAQQNDGWLRYDAAGVLVDSDYADSDVAGEIAKGYTVEYGPTIPWTYEVDLVGTGSYRTNVRLMKD